jgi:AcrR family transcriptional regulator
MDEATAALQRAVDAGELPRGLNPPAAMHVLWGALVGPSVLALCDRLAPGEDRDRLASDVLDAVIAGLQAGCPTTFSPRDCAGDQPGVTPIGAPHEA